MISSYAYSKARLAMKNKPMMIVLPAYDPEEVMTSSEAVL